jgi:HSP20 family protein
MKDNNENTSLAKQEEGNVQRMDDIPVFAPSTDIYEENDAIVIVSDMPGVDQQNLDITLENDTLTVEGKQSLPEPPKHRQLHHGYDPGKYKRSFNLLTEIDKDKITAKIDNGVLTVTLPKSEETKPRKIEINVA